MKRTTLLLLICNIIFMMSAQTTKKKQCQFVGNILEKDQLANSIYKAIKEVKMEDHLYCDRNKDIMLYYLNGRDDIQVGFFYNVESGENGSVAEKIHFTKNITKIYKKVKGKDKIKPKITFRSFLISRTGVYAMGKVSYNEKGKLTTYVNEANKFTVHGRHSPYGRLDGDVFSYTSDIIW